MTSFEFQSVLFNFHDVILLMTAMQCLFFAVLLCITNVNKIKSSFFLASFLIAHALIPMNELMFWGAEFKVLSRNLIPNLYLIPEFSYFVDAPLLFLCIKSLVFRDFALRKQDLLHLVPMVVYFVFLSTTFYTHTSDERIQMLHNESFVYSAGYVYLDFICKTLRVSYAVACFLLMNKYLNLLKATYSNVEKAHINWLNCLVMGFMVVMISETILVGSKIINLYEPMNLEIFSYIGLTGNYLSFILVNLLVFTAISYFSIFEQVNDDVAEQKPPSDSFINPEITNEVDISITESKIYLDPDLTLEKLAESLKMLPRDLSLLINRNFGINFYEFINRYRIEEAKKLLVDPKYKDTTITDIYLTVGFNSKSVFYTFFKKFVGVTPSSFKQASITK